MSIQEILEAHRARSTGLVYCECERKFNTDKTHRAHVAEVLEQYMHQTRRGVWGRAYSAGWNDGEWRDNPYTGKENPNGR